MARPKAPRWLTEAFRDGIDERDTVVVSSGERKYYGCQLAQHDPLERPCLGRLERIHWIGRQRVENAMWDAFFGALYLDEADCPVPVPFDSVWELTLLAGWDPRNGGIACADEHHARLDSHREPRLIIPASVLPNCVHDFAADWGLESQLEARYPSEVANV